jgi:hypothetical protein
MAQTLFSLAAARVAANVATLCFVLVAVLQLLLALGVLPVTMAWGGSQANLTPQLQIASVAAALLLGLFAYVIRRRAGLVGSMPPSGFIRIAAWVITIFMALNTLGNFASQSRGEALLFGPITLVLVLSCLLVSASRLDRP